MNLRTLLISGMLTMSLSVAADGWKGRPVDFSHGRIMVSENHRFLQHEDGTPFFSATRPGNCSIVCRARRQTPIFQTVHRSVSP